MKRNRGLSTWVLLMAAIGWGVAATAGTKTWKGTASSDWADSANWLEGAAPVDGDALMFGTNTFSGSQPVNNTLSGLSVNMLYFTNPPSGGIVLGGNAITLGSGGLTNANTFAGRDVVISNNVTIGAPQIWNFGGSANAITIINGSLSGAVGNYITNYTTLDATSGTRPALRLAGSNSGYLGNIVCNVNTRGLQLLNPAAMIGGCLDINGGNAALWIHGPGGTYTFGIGTGAGCVNFRAGGSGGLAISGGDATWDPGNGGNYTWTSTGNSFINLNGREAANSNSVLYIGNPAGALILTGAGSKQVVNGNAPNGQITVMRFALSDDGTARPFTTSALLLLLTRPPDSRGGAANLGGATVVSGGSLAITNMNQLFSGNLTLSGGAIVLDGAGVMAPSFADFQAGRSLGYGAGANQWQLTGGGFAARGSPLTISGGPATQFNVNFVLGGAARWTNGNAYADAPVIVAQDIQFANAARTITLNGLNAENAVQWAVSGPVNEISGLLSGGGASGVLNIQGGSVTAGGTLRISNSNNTYTGAINVGLNGGGIAIFSSPGAFGNEANAVSIVPGGSGQAGLLLLENQGGGTSVFTRSFSAPLGNNSSGGESGFGSWQGNVRYDGTLTVTGSANVATLRMPIHVQSGTLSFGAGAAFTNNHSMAGTFTYNKGGTGELDLRNLAFAGSKTDWVLALRRGSLITSATNQVCGPSAVLDLDNLIGGSTSSGSTWHIVDADQTYYSASHNYAPGITVTVDDGLTLTTDSGANSTSPSEVMGLVVNTPAWACVKNGGGTWVFRNSDLATPASSGPTDGAGYLQVDAGTLDITGDYGRGSLRLNGGTLLSGAFSPFTYGSSTLPFGVGISQNNLFGISSLGGRLGISPTAVGDVLRTGTVNDWDQSGTSTLVLAARTNLNLVFANAAFPDVLAGNTVQIERDGAGTGVVRIADTAWTNRGTLAGSGTLVLGASGNGTNTLAGTVRPGGAGMGTLTVVGKVVMTADTTSDFQLAGPGTGDVLAVTGSLVLDGTLNIATNTGLAVGTYTLMTCSGTITDNGLTIGMAPSPFTYSLSVGAGSVQLTVMQPEIAVFGNNTSIENGDITPAIADATDFGAVSADGAGGAYAEKTFTITNASQGTLFLSGSPAVALSGPGVDVFSVVEPPALTSLVANAAVTFTVRFDPVAIASSTVTVTLANNDLDEAPFTFALQGAGVGGGPTIGLLGTDGASIADGDGVPALADGTDFGTLAGGAVDHVFAITNSGSANVTLDGAPYVAVTGAHPGDFVVTAQPAANTVLPGAALPFTVRFAPSAAGLRQATLSIVNNDAPRNPYTFAVQGTYAGPEAAVLGVDGSEIGAGDVTPAIADGTDFGDVAVYGASQTSTFTVTNSGAAVLTLSGSPAVSVSGPASGDFTVTVQPSPTNVAVGGAVTFQVRFDPSVAGARAATVTLANNDPDESAYSFAVTGTGTLPAMTVLGINGAGITDGDASPLAADGTDFGAVETGPGELTRTFTITNGGPANLVLTGAPAVVLGGANPGDFSLVQPGSATVAAGAGVTFGVRFAPTANGVRSATVSIGNSDPAHDPYDFTVQGVGVPVTRVWSGSASTNWSEAGNWVGNQVPTAGNNLLFAQTNPPSPTAHNDLVGLSVQTLAFSNNTFTSGFTLAGNALTLVGGLTNGNTTAGRTVTINNDLVIGANQSWGSAGDVDAVTVVNGNLSGTGSVTLVQGYQSDGYGLPNLRLGGTNAAFTGTLTTAGFDSFGLQYLSPAAQIGGQVDLNSGNRNLWLAGSSAANPYTFGIGVGPGRVLFRGAGTGGALLTGSDVYWDPAQGGSYTWTNSGTASSQVHIGGTVDATPRHLHFGNDTGTLTLGQNVTLALGGGTFAGLVEMRYALADDAGSSRSLSTTLGLLKMTRPAISDATPGTTTVAGGALAASNMNQLFDGNLNLSGGVMLLDGLSWGGFTAGRPGGYGVGTSMWQLTGGGFAARGTPVTIDGTQTTTTTFDRDFRLGASARETNLALYANAAVTVAQDIVLSAAANRSIMVAGMNNETHSLPGLGTPPQAWLVAGPVHEIAGRITGGAAGRQLLLNGNGNGSTVAGSGGTLRLANTANDYTATNLLSATGGNLALVVPDDAVLGNPANAVIVGTGGGGPDSVLLFEDQAGTGKGFSRSLTLSSGDPSATRSGFGSYAGQVFYTGTVTRTDAGGPATTVVYTHGGSRFLLGTAEAAATLGFTGTQNPLTFLKEGAGELVISNLVYSTGGRVLRWALMDGTLVTTLDPSATDNPLGGQLRSVGVASLADIAGSGSSTNTKTWAVRGMSQTYTNMAGVGWSGQFTIDVAAGLTLVTHSTNAFTAQESSASDGVAFWDMIKTGAGTWTYVNGSSSAAAYGRRNNVRVDQGVFNVMGDMGRAGLTLNGGTVLVGNFSPFNGDGLGTQRLLIGPGGGKLGLSASATSSVTRVTAVESWSPSASYTTTLAARDNYHLAFNVAMTNLGTNVSVMIERDGSGTGEVRIANATWSVAGTLGGSGTLRLTGAGAHAITNSGTLYPGSSPADFGTLTITNADLVLQPGSVLRFNLGTSGANDTVVVNGNLTLAGTFALTCEEGIEQGSYAVMRYTGALTTNAFTVAPLSGGRKATVDLSTPGIVMVRVVSFSGTVFKVQ